MRTHTDGNSIVFDGVNDLNLALTFDCGQAFRWSRNTDGSWHAAVKDRSVDVIQQGNTITVRGDTDSWFWIKYLDLECDYGAICRRLKTDKWLNTAITEYGGIRILRQDPWEALCSFIISQNNNIPRIKGIISRLCENFGDRIGGTNLFSFPSAEKISSLTEDDLAVIRSGFRAKYILAGANAALEDGFLESMYYLPIDEARKKIKTVKGIGPKVADCALLYGFHRTECFPVDVWMKKAMGKLLPDVDPSIFGTDAGIAQQYIFHYSRMHPELF